MIEGARFDAITFDVYGTILDWEPEIAGFLDAWASSCGLTIDRPELLSAYDRLRQPLQDERPALSYPEILRQTLQRLGDEYGVEVADDLLDRFSGIAATHEPFADSVQALDALRAMGFKLAALSNIDDDSFAKATAAAGITFDVVVTAERVGGPNRPSPTSRPMALRPSRECWERTERQDVLASHMFAGVVYSRPAIVSRQNSMVGS